MSRIRPIAFCLAASLPLLACSQPPPPPPPPAPPAASHEAPRTIIGRHVEKAIAEARRELRTENISIGDGMSIKVNGRRIHRADDLPKAEITPAGDLLIGGKAVAVEPAQRAQLLQYRAHVIAIAEAGMEIGVQGADLATKAVGEAIGAIFSGDKDGIDERMHAEGEKIKAEAMKICAQLPSLLASQQALAASLPAFKPYATMTQEDVDDCGDDDEPHVAVTHG